MVDWLLFVMQVLYVCNCWLTDASSHAIQHISLLLAQLEYPPTISIMGKEHGKYTLIDICHRILNKYNLTEYLVMLCYILVHDCIQLATLIDLTGPTYGSAKAPLVASAGKDHVIFSKKLLLTICEYQLSYFRCIKDAFLSSSFSSVWSLLQCVKLF